MTFDEKAVEMQRLGDGLLAAIEASPASEQVDVVLGAIAAVVAGVASATAHPQEAVNLMTTTARAIISGDMLRAVTSLSTKGMTQQ